MPRSRPKIDSKVTQKQVKKESKSCFFYVSAKILCKERRSRRFGKIKQMENVWSGLASAVLIPDSLSMGVKKFEKNGPKTSSKVSSKLVKVAFIFSFILSRGIYFWVVECVFWGAPGWPWTVLSLTQKTSTARRAVTPARRAPCGANIFKNFALRSYQNFSKN